jgi:hypothetical protein
VSTGIINGGEENKHKKKKTMHGRMDTAIQSLLKIQGLNKPKNALTYTNKIIPYSRSGTDSVTQKRIPRTRSIAMAQGNKKSYWADNPSVTHKQKQS